jgi:hypothetical protein
MLAQLKKDKNGNIDLNRAIEQAQIEDFTNAYLTGKSDIKEEDLEDSTMYLTNLKEGTRNGISIMDYKIGKR